MWKSKFSKVVNVNKCLSYSQIVSAMSKLRKVRKIDKTITENTDDDIVQSHLILNTAYKSNKVKYDFYNVPCENLAKSLLGMILVRKLNDGICLRGRIVETECYLGGEDKASNTYNGRRTPANEPMYMKPGTAFVYLTYGMYHCFNISSDGEGAAVLLRAVEPLEGLSNMQEYRKTQKRKKELKTHELCNGPSKLCISFQITKKYSNKLDLSDNEDLWIEHADSNNEITIVTSSRIGIESAGQEWAQKPLRFYILNSPSVSRRDKIVEESITQRLS